MKPRVVRQLAYYFDPIYFRPENPGRIAECLLRTGRMILPEQTDESCITQRKRDRRCGVERRNRQLPVFLDTRSPHARRRQRQQQYQDETEFRQHDIGIDVYT